MPRDQFLHRVVCMPRLLVAEDDAQIQQLLLYIFTNSGFDVHPATDGQDAIDQLQADRFDALVLDLMMPRVNGLQVLEFIRQEMPDMMKKTVVTTAFGELASRNHLDHVGAVIRKPFDVQRLISAVRECTGAAE